MKLSKLTLCVLALSMILSAAACGGEDSTGNSGADGDRTTAASTTAHVHAFSEDWQNDREVHWQVCSCGEVSERSAHSWSGLSCEVCGTAKPEDVTTVKDRDEWNAVFSAQSFVNVTFEIESRLESGDSYADFYSKIMIDGTKAKAAEKIAGKELFEEKARYYHLEAHTYQIWNTESGQWEESYIAEDSGIERLISAVYDDNILLFARDYYENYSYDEQKQAYVWAAGAMTVECYILNGRFVRMVLTMGEAQITTALTDYGTTEVTYPAGVSAP